MRLIDQNDRTEVFEGNKLSGYVEDGEVYRFDDQGYAVLIGNADAREDIPGMFAPAVKTDPVVERNRQMLLERSQLGIAKYGTTLADNDLSLREWLQHQLEELLDAANYVQAAIMKLDKDG